MNGKSGLKFLGSNESRMYMSIEYDIYLNSHKSNTMIAFDWLCEYVFDSDFIADWIVGTVARNIRNHDESKYSTEEYRAYDDWFYSEKRDRKVFEENFNKSWLHHIHNNPHHWQHWVLINDDAELGTVALEMPMEYVIEMICDWWSFSWNTGNLYEIFNWYEKNKEHIILHDNTRLEVERILSAMEEKLDANK